MAQKVIKDDLLIEESVLTCGIVMPISAIDNCSAEHWKDVYKIISESIDGAGFKGRLVSESEDSGIIQKRIIQNLYDDPIVVVDVSGKNPNVMFELGLRLAFDKPTIVIKDDATSYSFDTSPIEHLAYPRDLRYQSIIDFKEKLKEKISATYKNATTDKNYTTFLKHFGTFKIAKLDEELVGKEDYILKSIQELKEDFRTSQRTRIKGLDLSEEKMAMLIVETRLKDYVIAKGLKSLYDIKAKNLVDDCFEVIEKFKDVRRVCGSPNTVRKYIDEITDQLPF